MSSLRSLALFALSAGFATVSAADVSGTGTTTRYWDCCKGSCSWTGKASVSNPVTTCDINDSPLTDYAAVSGCDGGDAYMCSSQSPWAVSDTLAYGFAAVSIPGGSESTWCCACYELTFTSTAIAGKKMIVQATNTGADLAGGQFDIAIPGGGVGIYNGCTDEWGAPSSGWGAQYGGISSNTCSAFPTALQPGCDFRFGDFFEGADNPTVSYTQVTCPKVLTDKTGCIRDGETPTGSDDTSSSSTAAAASTSSTAVASTAAASTAAASSASVAETSSTEVAPVSSSSATSASVAESSSTEAAPTSSASATSAPAYTAPSSSSSSSSEAAPVTEATSSTVSSSAYVSSAYSFTGTYGTAPAGTGAASSGYAPAPSGAAPGGDYCEIQYVYEYE
ncbi:hypothetical protein LTR36_004782 [Oleoguttula mirabilis]|uniref:Cellulase n=1 Tax=Oleoguttula mirabilis TaxID=1507867 RepID=A0AAV9JFJ0_9PEZI|nr:hypothetical protein LTR36_004782 [Oleoguttula mirabilis]